MLRLLPVAVLSMACSGSDTGYADALAPDPTAVYWRLQVNHHAITLSTAAPWDTVTLRATPYTYTGAIVSGDSVALTYTSADTNAVRVSPNGFIQAKRVTSTTRIFVRLRLGNLTYADTVFVKVVNNVAPKTLQSLSIQPAPSDSAKWAIDYPIFLGSFLKRPAVQGGEMTEILVNYESLDPVNVPINRQTGVSSILPLKTGSFKIVATAYAYGVTKADTLDVTIGYPLLLNMYFSVRNAADGTVEMFADNGSERTIGVGGEVTFGNPTQNDISITFSDTTNIQVVDMGMGPEEPVNRTLYGGDRDLFDLERYMQRRFIAPGVYTFQTNRGFTGVIRVIDDSAP